MTQPAGEPGPQPEHQAGINPSTSPALPSHRRSPSLKQSSRALRWTIGVSAAAMTALGLVLLFLLTQATDNREMYERNYARLFTLNVVVAVLLLLAIVWIAYRLWSRVRRGRFGSRLLVKIAAVFALAGLAPGLLIYVVSYQFVARSIESWFDVKVEGALDAGLNLGRATLDVLSSDLAAKTRAAANLIADAPDATVSLPLERLRDQIGAVDAVLWNASGQAIGTAGQSRFQLAPERPSSQQFRNARSQKSITWIEGLEDATSALPEGTSKPWCQSAVPGLNCRESHAI